MMPVGDWAKDRLVKLSETDEARDDSRESGKSDNSISNQMGRDLMYPTTVIHMATECSNRKHSAAFPLGLPLWFIKLFTDADDVVLDPFSGSGTTVVTAAQLKRHYVGIDIYEEYCQIAGNRLQQQVSQMRAGSTTAA